MELIKGIPVSPGVIIGRVFVLEDEHRRIRPRQIRPERVETELTRLGVAIQRSIVELQNVKERAEAEMGVEAAKIFVFHIGMLRDEALISPMRDMIASDHVSAESAVYTTLETLSERFKAMGDSAFTTKVNDLSDLSVRLLRHLIGERKQELAHLTHETIVLATDLTPSQTAAFDRAKVKAFVTELGGRTSHTAIVARALSIPAVVGCEKITQKASNGSIAIVDGDRGIVIIEPDEEKLEEYRTIIEQQAHLRLSLRELADLPSVTRDGTPIELLGNIEFPDEAATVLEHGGAGIGLYRTEFLYLTGDHEPTEDEQLDAYRRCIDHLGGRPLTIRTMDLGADKLTQEHIEIAERNPFLGMRSIRYSLRNRPEFKSQLRAILRASAYGPVKVMFPLITTAPEFRQARWVLKDVMEDLADEGIEYDPNVAVGMMVEVPAAALMAHVFAREVDFFSIGTNDLVQYTLAVDRTNERVADMFSPAHPGVMKLIQHTVRSANRRDIPVSCCGESAGDLDFAILLIGLGLRTLSVTASSIPGLKSMIRSVTIPQCERIARRALSFDSDGEAANYIRNQARKIIPDAFDGRSVEE